MKYLSVFFLMCFAACEADPGVPAELKPEAMIVEGEACIPLVVKEVIPVGKVCLSVRKDFLRVRITTQDRWRIEAAHFWMDFGLEALPVNRIGAPIFEWFPFVEHPAKLPDELVFEVPLDDYGYDPHEDVCMPQEVYMMVHARVFRALSGGRLQRMEAFAQGQRLRPQGMPAMYFQRILNCGRNPDPNLW